MPRFGICQFQKVVFFGKTDCKVWSKNFVSKLYVGLVELCVNFSPINRLPLNSWNNFELFEHRNFEFISRIGWVMHDFPKLVHFQVWTAFWAIFGAKTTIRQVKLVLKTDLMDFILHIFTISIIFNKKLGISSWKVTFPRFQFLAMEPTLGAGHFTILHFRASLDPDTTFLVKSAMLLIIFKGTSQSEWLFMFIFSRKLQK